MTQVVVYRRLALILTILFSSASSQPGPVNPHPLLHDLDRILPNELGQILTYCGLRADQRGKRGEDQERVLPSERIYAGQNAEPGDFPAAVWLGFWKDGRRQLISCGGTLITRRHIITVAHCFQLLK